MKCPRPTLRITFLLAMVSLAPIAADARPYSGPKCLGPVCFDGSQTFEGLAQDLAGPSSSGGVYGYRSNNSKTFLIITEGSHGEVGTIGLRDFAEYGMWTAKDAKQTTLDIRNWKTPDGIGLGSAEADIVKAYGPPSGVEDLELEDSDHHKGDRLLLYKGQIKGTVRAARFRIRDGKTSQIELENAAFVGPDCLGLFCTYGDVSFNSLVRHLGFPVQKNAPSSVECFQSKDGSAAIHFATDVEETFGVADFLLSEFPNCLHKRKGITAAELRTWKTPEGIGLGSPEEDVVKAYGPPSAERKVNAQKSPPEMKGLLVGYRTADNPPRTADKILIYGPRELQAVDFGIRNGKVSYIWLKESDFWLKVGK